MNTATVSLCILGSAAVLWIATAGATRSVRIEARTMRDQAAESRDETTQLRMNLSGSRARLADLEAEKDSLVEWNGAKPALSSTPRTGPDTEGAWPVGKPYFHLAKRWVGHVGYKTYGDDQELSPVAIALFGMSAAEIESVNGATGRLLECVKDFDLRTGERQAAPEDPARPGRRAISFRLQPLPVESASWLERFKIEVGGVLGPERTEPFLRRAIESLGIQLTRPREVRLTFEVDGGNLHRAQIHTIPGSGMYGFEFPIGQEHPLFPFRHLLESLEPLEPR